MTGSSGPVTVMTDQCEKVYNYIRHIADVMCQCDDSLEGQTGLHSRQEVEKEANIEKVLVDLEEIAVTRLNPVLMALSPWVIPASIVEKRHTEPEAHGIVDSRTIVDDEQTALHFKIIIQNYRNTISHYLLTFVDASAAIMMSVDGCRLAAADVLLLSLASHLGNEIMRRGSENNEEVLKIRSKSVLSWQKLVEA